MKKKKIKKTPVFLKHLPVTKRNKLMSKYVSQMPFLTITTFGADQASGHLI